MGMREWINLVERQLTDVRSFYLHVTRLTNLVSIQAHGLVPNHNGGNYDDMRWASLEGVYASRYAIQLRDYLNAHEIADYLLIVIEVDMKKALPDEDTIDIIFDHVLKSMLQADGYQLRSPEIEDMYPGDESFENYVERLAVGFSELAGDQHGDLPEGLIHEAAEAWLEMKLGVDGEAEFTWGDTKEKLVRIFSRMEHPELKSRHSVRIPNVVGFDGSTRIVGIVRVEDDGPPEMIYNHVPLHATDEVKRLVHAIV
jgi:hypothetical protein